MRDNISSWDILDWKVFAITILVLFGIGSIEFNLSMGAFVALFFAHYWTLCKLIVTENRYLLIPWLLLSAIAIYLGLLFLVLVSVMAVALPFLVIKGFAWFTSKTIRILYKDLD